MEYNYQMRVRYHHTDKMSYVYYANYLKFFEEARIELLRHYGVSYQEMEEKHNLYMPASEVHIKYMAPLFFDDQIVIRTFVSEMRRASIKISYEILRKDKITTTGYSIHPLTNKRGRPQKIPLQLKTIFTQA